MQPGAGGAQAFVEVVECLSGAFERPSECLGELGCGDDAGQAQEGGFDGAVVAAGFDGFVGAASEQLGGGDAEQLGEPVQERERQLFVVGGCLERANRAGADSERTGEAAGREAGLKAQTTDLRGIEPRTVREQWVGGCHSGWSVRPRRRIQCSCCRAAGEDQPATSGRPVSRVTLRSRCWMPAAVRR